MVIAGFEIIENVFNLAVSVNQEADAMDPVIGFPHKRFLAPDAKLLADLMILIIYLIVEEGFYKRTLDIHRTLGLLLHTQVSIQQLLKLPAECFHPKPKVNSVLIKLTRHTTDVPDKYWKLYTYFVSKWVNREYRQLFTKNQFHQAMKHAKVNNLSTVTYEQVLSIFNSYLLFNGRK